MNVIIHLFLASQATLEACSSTYLKRLLILSLYPLDIPLYIHIPPHPTPGGCLFWHTKHDPVPTTTVSLYGSTFVELPYDGTTNQLCAETACADRLLRSGNMEGNTSAAATESIWFSVAATRGPLGEWDGYQALEFSACMSLRDMAAQVRSLPTALPSTN